MNNHFFFLQSLSSPSLPHQTETSRMAQVINHEAVRPTSRVKTVRLTSISKSQRESIKKHNNNPEKLINYKSSAMSSEYQAAVPAVVAQ